MDQKVQEYIVRGQEKERKKQGEIPSSFLVIFIFCDILNAHNSESPHSLHSLVDKS